MFLYKDNRFHINNISFCLPNNVYINTKCDEYQKCIELIPNGEDFRIIVYAENGDAKRFFGKTEVEECYCWVSESSPFSVNNVNGYSCAYKSTYNSYVEYRFNTNSETEATVFGVLICRNIGTKTNDVITHPAVSSLLDSLKIEV